MSYRLRPFFECIISFLGFSNEEQKHMEELTIENGKTEEDITALETALECSLLFRLICWIMSTSGSSTLYLAHTSAIWTTLAVFP